MKVISEILPPPLGYRKNIPLYYPKTEQEIKADKYEIYNPNVVRSCRNFYEGDYGEVLYHEVVKWIDKRDNDCALKVLELGCGAGYLLGNLARNFPTFDCIGLDYSYQMLKMATNVFRSEGNAVYNRALQNGMEDIEIPNYNLENVIFALSDACVTPLKDETIDYCFSCFLWDRVGDPQKLLLEKVRILKPGGRILIISPFNYLNEKGWKNWHPLHKVIEGARKEGLELLGQEHFTIEELLDIRGNRVVWEVDSVVFQKVETNSRN